MKSLSIVTAILLIADINLVYAGDVSDEIKNNGTCPLVCTRPGTSLNADKCMCVPGKGTMSDKGGAKSSMHYIGSRITEKGSEITIYKDGNGNFIAIHPDKEPPNHYKKSKTLKGILGFEESDVKGSGVSHKSHKKVSSQTPKTKKIAGSSAAKSMRITDGAKADHKSHKKVSKQTPSIKKESVDTVVLGGKSFKIGKKAGGTDNMPNTKIKSGSTAGLVKNTNGTDKVFATITKRGTKEKIKVYKDAANDVWITSGKDGTLTRHGRGKSLEDIFKVENHEGPISARDKYRIELDRWKREEAYRKKLAEAEEAVRSGRKPKKEIITKQTPSIKVASGSKVELVKGKDGADRVYATITKRGAGEKIKVYKEVTSGLWVTFDKDGHPVRYGKNKSLGDVFKAENHVGPISARDTYRIELDQWNRDEAYRKKLEVAEEAARKK